MKSQVANAHNKGSRKTAIFLLSLEQKMAAEVLGRLSREQVEQITLEIANTANVTREEQETVLNEFKEAFAARPLMQPAGPETARELLERTLDRNDVETVTVRIEDQHRAGPFAFLSNRHPDDIRLLLETEHPQTIAVVAAQLPPELSARVLGEFGVELQTDILARIARLGPTDGELLEEIAILLKDRIGRVPIRSGGVSRAADVLRESSRTTALSVLQSLDQNDSKLAENLRESLFTFNDLHLLGESSLKLVLQETDRCPWAIALKGASEPLRQHVFDSMHPGIVQALKEEIRSTGPIPLSEITTAQRRIAEIVASLETEGRIDLKRKGQIHRHVDAA